MNLIVLLILLILLVLLVKILLVLILFLLFTFIYPILYLCKYLKKTILLLILAFIWGIYAHNPAISISLTLIIFSFLQSILNDDFLTSFGMYKEINLKGEKESLHQKILSDRINLNNMVILFTIVNLFLPKFFSFFKRKALKNVSAVIPFINQHTQLAISIYYQYVLVLFIVIIGSKILLKLEKHFVPYMRQYYKK